MTTTNNPREIAFNGVRLRFDSKKSFDELVSALLADVGEKPLMIDDLPAKFDSWESYKAEVESHVGPSGFILFAVMNHGAWIKKVQIQKKVLRVVIGNPLLAITMLRHDLTAGLFAPVELILIEEDDDQSSLTYVRPSSLMVVETNEPLLAAARELDAKLQALAAKVTATKATGPLAVLEAAFKIIPGKETDFLAYQASVVPLAAAQPGFRAAYSGPVWDSTWVYFGARFDSEEQMNAWLRWARSAFLLFLRCRRISSNVMMAAMSFRTLNARQLVEKVVGGTKYDDAEEVKVRDAA
jgi:uncharacterized protein (DUF302 family)